MLTDEPLNINERRRYLQQMKPRYDLANRTERGVLLTEMEAVTGLHRKSLVRLCAAGSLERTPRQRQRQVAYGRDVEQAVLVVWQSLDGICAERLTPVLAEMARHLAGFGALHLTDAVLAQLQLISRATVERMLARHRHLMPRLPRPGPRAGNVHSRGVPMQRIPWQTRDPGHCEIDLVHHSGASAEGEYAHTIQCVDIATGWSERVAILGRGQQAMVAGLRQILAAMPFVITELHPDNGSEFFNAHVLRFVRDEHPEIQLSRSRPYHKNDNRFVEQKNDTLVRGYVGYQRVDTRQQVERLNALYADLRLYNNLFQPVFHQIAKEFDAGVVRRQHDIPQTPFQRAKASGMGMPSAIEDAHHRYLLTNPQQLRRRIYQRIAALTTVPASAEEAAASSADAGGSRTQEAVG
jgi:hypothetical protein